MDVGRNSTGSVFFSGLALSLFPDSWNPMEKYRLHCCCYCSYSSHYFDCCQHSDDDDDDDDDGDVWDHDDDDDDDDDDGESFRGSRSPKP